MGRQRYHHTDLSTSTFLITGGAGFIGSHLADYLMDFGAQRVIVVDDFSTGSRQNIQHHIGNERFEFVEADICDTAKMTGLISGVSYVLHQAALGSVPRSISEPLATHHSNATGFLSVLEACRKAKVRRLVFASSSSVYGDSTELPKVEDKIGFPKSPYAVTKLMDEYYGMLYSRLHSMSIIGLRYFNIFGPRQNPNGPYAAAIPLFIQAALSGDRPVIFGDGEQSRDFTFVENAVQANIRALFAEELRCGEVYNIACGNEFSLNEILAEVGKILSADLKAEYRDARQGDIRNSLASISKAEAIGYKPEVDLKTGLKIAIDWYRENSLNQKSSSRVIGQ